MDTLLKDIRYGIRSLLKRPGLLTIAIVTLALGIGANTAICSLINTILLRPMPFTNPEQIVSVSVRGKGDSILAFSHANYLDFRDRNQVLSGLLGLAESRMLAESSRCSIGLPPESKSQWK